MMKNAWFVRPYPHGIRRLDEFKNQEIIAIGWPGIGDLNGKSREEIKSILESNPYNLGSIELGTASATVDLFVNRMQLGDIVLVPDGEDIYFCEITSDYYLASNVDNNKEGYPRQRQVKWLKATLRKNLSLELRNALKNQRTAADLTKYYKEINALSAGKKYSSGNTNFVAVSYPLRKDFIISFEIPEDITKDEAERLSAYVSTLYFTE
ncbi:MAG: restriction endonuclease [Culicoidibacterales bacterium]